MDPNKIKFPTSLKRWKPPIDISPGIVRLYPLVSKGKPVKFPPLYKNENNRKGGRKSRFTIEERLARQKRIEEYYKDRPKRSYEYKKINLSLDEMRRSSRLKKSAKLFDMEETTLVIF